MVDAICRRSVSFRIAILLLNNSKILIVWEICQISSIAFTKIMHDSPCQIFSTIEGHSNPLFIVFAIIILVTLFTVRFSFVAFGVEANLV